MDKIFKFPPQLYPFRQIDYLYELFSSSIIQFKNDVFGLISRLLGRGFLNYIQEAVWLTAINKICKFQPHLETVFFKELFLQSLLRPKMIYIWASFELVKIF